jgi:hypothetical protein
MNMGVFSNPYNPVINFIQSHPDPLVKKNGKKTHILLIHQRHLRGKPITKDTLGETLAPNTH